MSAEVADLKSALDYSKDSINHDLVLYAVNGTGNLSTYLTVKQENNRLTLNGTSNATATQATTKCLLSDHLECWNATTVPTTADVYTLNLLKGHKYKLKAKFVSGTRDKTTGTGNLFFRLFNSGGQVFTMTLGIDATSVEGYYKSDGTALAVRMQWGRLLKATDVVIDFTIQDVTADHSNLFYVSANGDDANSGLTSSDPKATVDSAIKAGADTICMMPGVYKQTIDLANCVSGLLNIFPYTTDSKVVFYGPNSLIANSASEVSGHSGVFSVPTTKAFNANRIWIFQDNVPDESTVITAEERMSLQLGLRTRCGDTKIVACSSDNVSDAIAEIEGASDYRFYYDSENAILYFSCPETVSASHPICTGFDSKLFLNTNRNIHLNVSGLTLKYVPMNLEGMTEPVCTECHVMGVCYDGGFMWDSACGVKLYRCEAEHIFKGVNGDGFNAHAAETGDADARQTTAMLFDCWGHDNQDDGYSDHERCATTIYGGLFEYNLNGGGVTPANGSHCTCYNVYSRHNTDGGFRCASSSSADDGGIGTSLDCFGCVSDSNGYYGWTYTYSTTQGKLVNCVAKNETTGFYGSNSAIKIELVNCSTYNCTNQKSGDATFEIQNGTPVT